MGTGIFQFIYDYSLFTILVFITNKIQIREGFEQFRKILARIAHILELIGQISTTYAQIFKCKSLKTTEVQGMLSKF